MYFIAHGGYASNPGWLYSIGFRGIGYVVDGSNGPGSTSIPSTSGARSAGFADIHLNPFNDQNNGGGLGSPYATGNTWAWWFQNAKNAGYTKIAGEGVVADVANRCVQIIPYLSYAGDIGGYQWDSYNSNPRGVYSSSGNFYIVPETYVYGNVPSLGSTESVMISAQNHKAGGVGFLLGSWCPDIGNWVSFTNTCRGAGANCQAVIFWCGMGYDITTEIQNKMMGAFNQIKAAFGVSNTWGSGVSPGPAEHTHHIWCGMSGQSGLYTATQPCNAYVGAYGQQGYVDSTGNWVPKAKLTAAEVASLTKPVNVVSKDPNAKVVTFATVIPDSNGSFSKNITGPGTSGLWHYNFQGSTGNWGNDFTVNWTAAVEKPIIPDTTPTNPNAFNATANLDIVGYLTKTHNGEPTTGIHTVTITPQEGSDTTVKMGVTVRSWQPGLE